MAAAKASKSLSRCAGVSFSAKFSKTLLGIDARGYPTGAGVWQRRSPSVPAQLAIRIGEKAMVEGESFWDLRKSGTSGMLDLDQSFMMGVLPKSSFQRGRRFPRRAVLGEEYKLASAGRRCSRRAILGEEDKLVSTGASQAAGGDMREESKECDLDESSGTSTLLLDTNTSEKLNLSTSASLQRWFPYEDCFKLDDERTLTSSEVISMLSPFLEDGRKKRIEDVVAHRTYSVCIAVEGLLDLGNISAVCRSADALGFQSVHVISNETKKKYKKNRKVSMGTEKWLDAEMWDNSSECIATLRKRGYRIAVTHIAPDTVSIHDMDWTIPTAVFFGNEFKGASEEAIEQSDIRCCIPMAGMVESFNVSVAAGILMHHAARDRITRSGMHGDISPEDRRILEAEFCLRHNRHTVPLLDRLLEKKKANGGGGSSMEIFSKEFLASIEEPEYLRTSDFQVSQ